MSEIKYNVNSERAEEFINDGEIRATLEYAQKHKADRALIDEILRKAEEGNGITHREAAVLIEVEDKAFEGSKEDILNSIRLSKRYLDNYLI